jgi:hypothetical protein
MVVDDDDRDRAILSHENENSQKPNKRREQKKKFHKQLVVAKASVTRTLLGKNAHLRRRTLAQHLRKEQRLDLARVILADREAIVGEDLFSSQSSDEVRENRLWSMHKSSAKNCAKILEDALYRGDRVVAAKAAKAMITITRKRKGEHLQNMNAGDYVSNSNGEKVKVDGSAQKKTKVIRWTQRVDYRDHAEIRAHEKLALRAALELESFEDALNDAREIYESLIEEADMGNEQSVARFESAFGELFTQMKLAEKEFNNNNNNNNNNNASIGEREKGKLSQQQTTTITKKKNEKKPKKPMRSRFSGYEEDDAIEIEMKEQEKMKNRTNRIETITMQVIKDLEINGNLRRGKGNPNFTRKYPVASRDMKTDAALLKFALWLNSITDQDLRRSLRRLEMCRPPLSRNELELKRRGKTNLKQFEERAWKEFGKQSPFGDEAKRKIAENAVSDLLAERSAMNITNSVENGVKLGIAKAMLLLAKFPSFWEEPNQTLIDVDDVLKTLVREQPDDKDAREALATFLIRAYELGYKDNANGNIIDCMDARNITSACISVLRVDPTCEIALRFLTKCWRFNFRAFDVKTIDSVIDLGTKYTDKKHKALAHERIDYIRKTIDDNELLHAVCERVECLPRDSKTWKFLSDALLGIEIGAFNSDQYAIIFQNMCINRSWWPERMFGSCDEICESNFQREYSYFEYKAIVAAIAFPLDARCLKYIDAFVKLVDMPTRKHPFPSNYDNLSILLSSPSSSPSRGENKKKSTSMSMSSVMKTEAKGIKNLIEFLTKRVFEKCKKLKGRPVQDFDDDFEDDDDDDNKSAQDKEALNVLQEINKVNVDDLLI